MPLSQMHRSLRRALPSLRVPLCLIALFLSGALSATAQAAWKISITYGGTVSYQVAIPAYYGSAVAGTGHSNLYPASGNVNPGQLPGPTSASGGIHAVCTAAIFAYPSSNLSLQGNAQVNVTLSYVGSDTPPKKVVVFYRNVANAAISADPYGISSTVSFSCGGANAFVSSASGPTSVTNSDPSFTQETLSLNGGSVTKTYDVSLNCQAQGADTPYFTSLSGLGGVDFAVAGFDLGRFGPATRPLSGGGGHGGSDPTFTRWLPLEFSPQITDQPFRFGPGLLPRPWGNIDCMYSIGLEQEPTPVPNYDLDGQSLIYQPSIGPDGTYNTPGAPYKVVPGPFVPAIVVTDSSGQRLPFDKNLTPYKNVHSTLVNVNAQTYQLQHAGPPGAIKEAGYYTYTFQSSGGTSWQLARIDDDCGNTQLIWPGNGSSFKVIDNTTGPGSANGRTLVFNGSYISSVDALEANGTVHTHTTLSWDATGHCTGIAVYSGDGLTLLRQDTFAYGGPNGDSVISAQQGLATVRYQWLTDSLAPDPFNLPIPRLQSKTEGWSDTASSDDGQAVAGTTRYTFGPMQAGYNSASVSARTNTETDARGNLFKTIFSLGGDTYGAISGLNYVGPDYTGAPANSNFSSVAYAPDIAQPTAVTVTNSLLNAWQQTFDGFGNLTSSADPNLNTWKMTYTPDGTHPTDLIDPTQAQWSWAWGEGGAPASRLTTSTDAANCPTTYTYNLYGQLATVACAAAFTASGQKEQTSYNYDSVTGDLTSLVNPLGDTLTLGSYDALGDPCTTTVYPDTGNPLTSIMPLTSTTVWDAAQRPVRITMGNGVTTANTWLNGVLTQVQCNAPAALGSALLGQTTLSYDSRGRVYAAADTLGTLYQYRYDKNSNVTRILDGRGNTTQLQYGPNNELIGKTWPGRQSSTILYDQVGRVRQTTDERGVVCTYLHDNTDRLTDLQFPATPTQNVHYTYDAAGRLLTVTDGSGSRAYQYDGAGRLKQVTTLLSALPAVHNRFAVVYTYFPDSHLATMTSPAGITHYSYDLGGRLVQITDPSGNSTFWSYDHLGRVLRQSTQMAGGGGSIASGYVYGPSGITGDPIAAPGYLRQIQQTVNGKPFWTYTLKHSVLGLLQGIQGSGPSSTTLAAIYGYDARGRLTSHSTTFPLDPQHSRTVTGNYSYDAAGNLNAGSGGWSYNTNNQLTAAPASGDLPGATGLSYDAAGNLTAFNGLTLNYDCWGRLGSVAGTPSGTVSYGYDSAGRRISKTVGGATTYCLYDGAARVADLDSGGNVIRSYSWGQGGPITDTSAGGRSRAYLYDPQGNTSALADGSGNLTPGSPIIPSPLLTGTAISLPTQFLEQGSSGYVSDSETPAIVCSGSGAPYVPPIGQYAAPSSNSLYNGGGSPYSVPTNNPLGNGYAGDGNAGGLSDDGDWALPASAPSNRDAVSPLMNGIHQVAGALKTALNIAAGFNPLCNLAEALSGQDAEGCHVSPLQRGLSGLAAATPLGFLGEAAEGLGAAGKAAPGAGKLAGKLGKILNKFPSDSGDCAKAAKAIQAALAKAGHSAPTIIEVTDQYKAPFLFDASGNQIGRFGWHQLVESDGRYYDALTGPHGVGSWEEYIKLWHSDCGPYLVPGPPIH